MNAFLDNVLDKLIKGDYRQNRLMIELTPICGKFSDDVDNNLGDIIDGFDKEDNQIQLLKIFKHSHNDFYDKPLRYNSIATIDYLIELYITLGHKIPENIKSILMEDRETNPIKDTNFCLEYLLRNTQIVSEILYKFLYAPRLKKILEGGTIEEQILSGGGDKFTNVDITITKEIAYNFLKEIYIKCDKNPEEKFEKHLAHYFNDIIDYYSHPHIIETFGLENKIIMFSELKRIKIPALKNILSSLKNGEFDKNTYNQFVERMKSPEIYTVTNIITQYLIGVYQHELEHNKINFNIEVLSIFENYFRDDIKYTSAEHIEKLMKVIDDVIKEIRIDNTKTDFEEYFIEMMERELLDALIQTNYFKIKREIKINNIL